MNAIKFLKLDIKMMRSQIKSLFLYPLFGLVMIFFIMNDMTFILGYMIFGFATMSTMPFSIENAKSKNVFYYTLPAKRESMVMGRFLVLFSGTALFAVMCTILIIVSVLKGGVITELQIFYYSIFVFASLVISLIQYAMFFKLGFIKSQQFYTLIQMLPGLIIWLSMSFGSKYMQNKGNPLDLLDYGRKHIMGSVIIEILLAGLIFYLSYNISCAICRKKEIL